MLLHSSASFWILVGFDPKILFWHAAYYKYKWNKCGCEYIGETSQNFYSRDQEHMKKFNEKSKESFMYTHQQEHHNSEPLDFTRTVLKSFKDTMSK